MGIYSQSHGRFGTPPRGASLPARASPSAVCARAPPVPRAGLFTWRKSRGKAPPRPSRSVEGELHGLVLRTRDMPLPLAQDVLPAFNVPVALRQKSFWLPPEGPNLARRRTAEAKEKAINGKTFGKACGPDLDKPLSECSLLEVGALAVEYCKNAEFLRDIRRRERRRASRRLRGRDGR